MAWAGAIAGREVAAGPGAGFGLSGRWGELGRGLLGLREKKGKGAELGLDLVVGVLGRFLVCCWVFLSLYFFKLHSNLIEFKPNLNSKPMHSAHKIYAPA